MWIWGVVNPEVAIRISSFLTILIKIFLFPKTVYVLFWNPLVTEEDVKRGCGLNLFTLSLNIFEVLSRIENIGKNYTAAILATISKWQSDYESDFIYLATLGQVLYQCFWHQKIQLKFEPEFLLAELFFTVLVTMLF